MSPGKLSTVILEHHEFLIDDQTLSEISMLLRDAVPNTFVEVLVSLIKSDIYSLQVSFWPPEIIFFDTLFFNNSDANLSFGRSINSIVLEYLYSFPNECYTPSK